MAKKDLSSDSIRDILCRLSVKSLVRFKSVSKPWCSLIDDPCFTNFHLKHSIETNRGASVIAESTNSPIKLLCSEDLDPPGKLVEINLPVEINSVEGITLIGSCNGLICYLIRLNDFQNVVIWNKSTGDFHVTRWPRYASGEHSPCIMQHGFGYDSINDDYKVVGISCLVFETQVYSLRNNTWKRTQNRGLPFILAILNEQSPLPNDRSEGLPFIHGFLTNHCKGLLAGGALHWMAKEHPDSRIPNSVLAFNLTTEVFRRISLPEQHTKCTAVGALGGCLTVTCWKEETDSLFGIIEIWVMEDLAKETWTKLLRVSLSRRTSLPIVQLTDHTRPLAYSRDGKKILLKSEFYGVFLWYNLGNEELEQIPTSHPVWSTEICLDTLVSISAYRGCKNNIRKRSREIGM